MKRVVTVSLHGISFNFDEDAYDAVRSYLQRAESQLRLDPGRAEVLADLERSIAEKCQAVLTSQKNVVTLDEVRAVLTQIGAVGGSNTDEWYSQNASAQDADARGGHARGAHARGAHARSAQSSERHLVQVREGAMVSGVCNGLAAHFGIDVTLLRVIFVLVAVASSGVWVLVYVAMMFLIPYDTEIEKINDQSVPAFMFKFVTHLKRKLAGTS